MNEPDQVSQEVRDLIDDYLSGQLDADRLRSLEDYLRADVEARRYFVRYCRLHTDLHLEVRSRQAGERTLRQLGLRGADTLPPRSRFTRRRRALLTAAAGLLLALGAGWWVAGRNQTPVPMSPDEVAWLVNAQNCLWSEGTAPDGAMRVGNTLSVEQGLAEIRMKSGVKLVLEGPASLELLSANEVRLVRGRLAARVPQPAVGFTVLSPKGRVIDLGTEFGVAVGDDGQTDVVVFEGQVLAAAVADKPVPVGRDQSARIRQDVALNDPNVQGTAGRFVRAIVPQPVVTPRTRTLDFRGPSDGTLSDANGRGTGLTHRLPGTGGWFGSRDPNLRLDPAAGQLVLSTTNSDLNHQYLVETGEYLGLRLADLGFTGAEDFAVTATFPRFPALEQVNQFGLYAGTHSGRNIRGGIFSPRPGHYTQNLVLNEDGRDRDSHFVGLITPGDSVRLALRRTGGRYSLAVENLTTSASTTLTTRHPAYLDGRSDLYVGLFGASTFSEVSKKLVVKEFAVTVWTVSTALTPPAPPGR